MPWAHPSMSLGMVHEFPRALRPASDVWGGEDGLGPGSAWEGLLEGQLQLLSELVGSSNLGSTLDRICRLVEAFNPDILASVLLLDPNGKTVHHGAAPSLPDGYWNAIEGACIGPQAGSCGTAMHRRERVIVTDIATDPLWEVYRAFALPHGLMACWSMPIFSPEGRVEGSFALYFRTPRSPSSDDLKLVDFAARLTGVALERIREHEHLQRALADLEAARVQAVAASQAKGTFLASMSHELRTPLNAILLLSELLAADAGLGGNTTAERDIQSIQSSARHLLSLVNGVLDLARIEAGATTFCWETLELAPFLEELGLSIQPLLASRDNRLRLDLDPQGLAFVTDVTKLRQILTNLLGNAAKFTQSSTITLAVDRWGGDVRFRVEDEGIGMTPDQLERVFGRFEQAQARTGRDHGGTGLGLTICQELCALLGGRIEAESRPGTGTTMTVLLPLKPRGDSLPLP